MAKIQYNDKVNIISQPVPEVNKVTAANLNEIKTSVNINVDNIALNATDLSLKADIGGNSSEIFKVSNGLSANDAINKTQLDNLETTLQGNIDSEALSRENADTTLQNNIDLKVDIASIVNNVTAGGVSVPLSAEQGKVLKSEILALSGSLIPQGNWDADTNTPDISGTTETGYYWLVSDAGSTDLGGITDWKVSDWVIKTANGWAKIDNTDKVLSVAGKIGEVVLGIADIASLQVSLDSKANLSGGNTFEGSQIFNNSTVGSLNKIIINNSINDSGLEVNNTDDAGFGLNINNTSTGIGSRTVNEIGGIGSFFVNNQDSFTEGNAIEIFNKGAGNSIFINNKTSGNGFVSNASESDSTGLNFVGKNEDVNTFTVDKEGNVLGLSFIGDGSALTNMPVSSAQQTALDLKANKASPSFTGDATFGESVHINGQILNSSANLQVNGFQRTGAIFIHEGGLYPDANSNSVKIQNIGGEIEIEEKFKVLGNATFGGEVNLESLKNTSIISLKSTTNDSSWSVGDRIGGIDFYSGDGSGAGSGKKASISYEVEEGNTGSSLAMVFRGAGVGSSENNLERLRIDSNGDFDFKSGNATFGGSVTASSFVGAIEENFTSLGATHTLTDTDYNVHNGQTASSSTVTIPTGLSAKRSWEFSAQGFNITISKASGVTINIITNGAPNNLTISGASSARLVATATANEFLLIK